MKITKVTYQAAYVTGPYLQHRIGFEAEIDGGNGEDEMKALATLKELADAFDKQVNNFEERMVSETPEPPIEVEQERVNGDDPQLAKAKADLEKIEFQEDAIFYLKNNGWIYTLELKNIANSKPKRP